MTHQINKTFQQKGIADNIRDPAKQIISNESPIIEIIPMIFFVKAKETAITRKAIMPTDNSATKPKQKEFDP